MANWVADFLAANANIQVVKRDRHALHVSGPGGTTIAYITGAPMHYLDAGEWRPLDTTLVALSGNYWGAPGCPARFNGADRTTEIIGTSYAQRTTRVAILDAANLSIKGARAVPVGSRSGDCLIADGVIGGAGWQHVLRLTESGVREELTLQAKPVGLPANAGDWLVLDTVIGGATFPDGWVEEFNQAGMHFPLPSASDANGDMPNCRRYARTVAGVQHIYTGIPVAWLATAAYPVSFDPNFTGDTVDGFIGGSNATYDTARSTSASYNSDAVTLAVGQMTEYSVNRSFLKFDTSTIGAGSTVTQVNLQMVCRWNYSDADFDVQIVKYSWAGQDPLSAGNRETAYDGCLAAALDDHIWRNTSGMATGTQYTSDILSTAWVNTTAPTYYGLRSSEDSAASAPVVLELIQPASASNDTAAYRPVLIVAYEAASTGFKHYLGLLGVGR